MWLNRAGIDAILVLRVEVAMLQAACEKIRYGCRACQTAKGMPVRGR